MALCSLLILELNQNYFLMEIKQILKIRNLVELNQKLLSLNEILFKLLNNELDYELSTQGQFLKQFFNNNEYSDILELLRYQPQDIQTIEFINNIILLSKLITRQFGTQLCKSLLKEIPIFYRNLGSGNHSLIQSNLELLTTMSQFSTSIGRDLFRLFNFQLKPLQDLLKVKKTRTILVKFIFSFLRLETKQEVLNLKLLELIFNYLQDFAVLLLIVG